MGVRSIWSGGIKSSQLHVGRKLIVRSAVVGALFIGFGDFSLADPPASLPYADFRVQQLIASNGCWTDSAPDGVIPGHVVITPVTGTQAVLGGGWMTTKALEQIFEGGEEVGTVHAFCP